MESPEIDQRGQRNSEVLQFSNGIEYEQPPVNTVTELPQEIWDEEIKKLMNDIRANRNRQTTEL
jgi:hypothetical protein